MTSSSLNKNCVLQLHLLLGSCLFFIGISWFDITLAAAPGPELSVQKERWSILVLNLQNDAVLLDQNATHAQLPASTAKLLATAYILDVLGPESHQRTLILGANPVAGILHGPLIFLGDGDPDLSSRRFPFVRQTERDDPMLPLQKMAKDIYAKGVRYIPDGIIAEAGRFPEDRNLPGWTKEDQRYWYGAPISALMFNDAMVSVEIRPASRPGRLALASINPNPMNIISNSVVTVAQAAEVKPVQLEQSGDHYVLSGAIRVKNGSFSGMLAQPTPPFFAAMALRQALEEEGVRVGPHTEVRHHSQNQYDPQQYPDTRILAEKQSPSLAEEVTVANKVSENTHVEVLLRDADLRRGGDGSGISAMQGFRDWLKRNGILQAEQSQLQDACGLSRDDRLSAQDIVSELKFSYLRPWGQTWRHSLPIAAVDGTLRHRLTELPEGSVRAKTGTLHNVVSLAGLIQNQQGVKYAFAIMVDHFQGSEASARARVDSMVREIVLGRVASSRPVVYQKSGFSLSP